MLNEPKFLKELPDGTFSEDLTGARFPLGLNYSNVSNIPIEADYSAPTDVTLIAGENIVQGDLVKMVGANAFKMITHIDGLIENTFPSGITLLPDNTSKFWYSIHLSGTLFAVFLSNSSNTLDSSSPTLHIVDSSTQSIVYTYNLGAKVFTVTPVPNTTKFAVYSVSESNSSQVKLFICDTSNFSQSPAGIINIGTSNFYFVRKGQVYVASPTSFFFFNSGVINYNSLQFFISRTSNTAIVNAELHREIIGTFSGGFGHFSSFCLILNSGQTLFFLYKSNSGIINAKKYSINLNTPTVSLLGTYPTAFNVPEDNEIQFSIYDTNKIACYIYQTNSDPVPIIIQYCTFNSSLGELNYNDIITLSYTENLGSIAYKNIILFSNRKEIIVIGLGSTISKVFVFLNPQINFVPDYEFVIGTGLIGLGYEEGSVSSTYDTWNINNPLPVYIGGMRNEIILNRLYLLIKLGSPPIFSLIATETKLAGQSVSCRVIGECPFYSGLIPGVQYYTNNGTNNIPKHQIQNGDIPKGLAISPTTLLIRKFYYEG